jgi:hypothetical protein
MKLGSLCALGSMTPLPIESLMRDFPEELARHRVKGGAGGPASPGRERHAEVGR